MVRQPKLGIQLYSVRDLTGDTTFRSTLSSLADMGFQGVEFAWKYGGMGPVELAAFLRSVGLECCGLHVQLDELLDPRHVVYDIAEACSSPYITTSLCSRIDQWHELVPQVAQAALVAKSRGLQFTYHNHYQEFTEVDGIHAQDILRDRTDPGDVQFELDLGWILKGGEDPMAYWQTYAGRVPQIHLRDYNPETDQVCDIGAGFIRVDRILDLARQTGTRWIIYEQDAYPVSPMASARICIERCQEAGLPGRSGERR